MDNLLFSSWYTGLGGGETDLLTLLEHLPRTRYTCHLLLPHEGQLAAAWRARGGTVHLIPFRGVTTWFVPALYTRMPVIRRIARLLHEEHITLIHADYHTLPFMVGAAQRTQTPLLWTLHGWWFRPHPWQEAFFRTLPTVARSYSIRGGFLGKPPFMPAAQIPVIHSGVDTQRFRPDAGGDALRAELMIAADAPLVAMVARFQSVKGHDTFQQIVQQVALQMPQARFVVAGDNVFGGSADNALRERLLKATLDEPLLRERLRYIGFREDVERVYAMADVVVCASDFESYGKANLEAMACATPVVSTAAGGPMETIVESETGFLVPPRDVLAFSVRVLELLRDADLRQRMGANAREHVQQHFAIAPMIAAYEAVFAQQMALK